MTQAVICGLLAFAPGLSAWFGVTSAPGAKVIYNLYATDGYARLDDGSVLHVYGFIGGREGEPLTYLDENGATRTMVQGPPAPAAGAVTEAEAMLAGRAQLVAPLIWASSEDVVELRLKNLGGAAGSPASPLGIELRGLDVSGADEGTPETSVLAIPVDTQLASSGNLLSYTFRISNPGTYAYGWSYSSHLGHEKHSDTQTSTSTQSMPMNCPCQAMQMQMSSQSMQMGAPDLVYSALDGALVVYNAADPAAQTGPGMGAGGAILGLHYDQDFVMLLTGAEDDPMDMAGMTGMPGMAAVPQSHGFLVNGSLPGTLSQKAGATSPAARNEQSIQRNYHPFVPQQLDSEAQHILVRILNLSGQAQPTAAVTQGYRSIAYQAHRLPWASPAVARAAWAEGSESGTRSDQGYPIIEPGESVDVLLDLGVPRQPAGTGQVAAVPFNTTGGATAGASGSALRAMSMPGGMAMSMPMSGTRSGTRSGTGSGTTTGTAQQCPMMGGMTISGTLTGTARQCPMMLAPDADAGVSQAATCMMTGLSSLWMNEE